MIHETLISVFQKYSISYVKLFYKNINQLKNAPNFFPATVLNVIYITTSFALLNSFPLYFKELRTNIKIRRLIL